MDNVAELTNNIESLFISENDINSFKPVEIGVSIKSPSSFKDEVHKAFDPNIVDTSPCMPWQKTKDLFRFRSGETTVWGGYKGHKKTMVTYQQAIDFARQGRTSVIASMEMHPVATLKRMARMAIGNANPTTEYINRFFNWVEGKIFIYDQQNTVSPQEILKMAKYCSEVLGLDNVFIDSLMKCGIASDDLPKQKWFLNELVAIGKYNGNHQHLVAHLRKTSSNANQFKMPCSDDIAGSADIANQAHNIILCWTDKKKKQELEKAPQDQKHEIISKPCQLLIVDKQRESSFEGSLALWFNNDSLTFREYEGSRPTEYWRCF